MVTGGDWWSVVTGAGNSGQLCVVSYILQKTEFFAEGRGGGVRREQRGRQRGDRGEAERRQRGDREERS